MEPQSQGTAQACPACNSRYDGDVTFCPKDGARLAPATPSGAPGDRLVGQVLADRYRILRKLGEGGMGEVYEAQHVYIDKRFALKLLRPEITANAEAVARFHQEARSASSIGHANIVEIDDFGRTPEGAVYLAMELLAGQSLADRMRKGGPITVDETLSIGIQVCSGLAAAHAKGIVHRDMKPENIFLSDARGFVLAKILDFGIAKVGGEGSQSLTRTGAIFGTPHYMSPEQALGRALDRRADVYSVGVILYEMATGRVPFQAESFMGILTQHITADAVAPRLAAPERDIPEALAALIVRAMAKDPEGRFASMEEMVEALSAIAGQLAPQLGEASQAFQAIDYESRLPSGSRAAVGRPASGAFRAAPARTPSGVIGAMGAAGSPSAAMPVAPARSSAGLVIALGLGGLVLIGGVIAGGVAFLKPTVVPAPPREVVTLPRKLPVSTESIPAGAPELEVLLDSEPTGARVLDGEKLLDQTPSLIKIQTGHPVTVTLRRDGYADRTVRVDGARRKIIEHLEHVHTPTVAHHPSPPPTPNPVIAPSPKPPIAHPPVVKPPTVRPPATGPVPIDPYQ